jgi:hypothetical protein
MYKKNKYNRLTLVLLLKIKNILGISLLGKLKSYVNEYEKKNYIFDSNNIICGISLSTGSKKLFSLWARTYCNNPLFWGNPSNLYCFWSADNFNNADDAFDFFEMEIINTSKKFADTKFYLLENDYCKKYFLNGIWYKCDGIPQIKYCQACYSSNEKDSVFCIECSEFID